MPVRVTRTPRRLAAAVCGIAVAVVLLPSCGRKTPVRPPEDVAPAAITELRADNTPGGVSLSWQRPRASADGGTLFDLDGFIVERALPGGPFGFITRLPVADRERLRQQRRFTYLDEQTLVGQVYRYRVLALTVDGFVSEPSNTVDVLRAVPTPGSTGHPPDGDAPPAVPR